jgi:hypothetical protein
MRALVAMLVLGGCNQAFDLRATISVDADTADVDGDGVGDASDNCATVVNADQLNADDDVFGDACDTCPMLSSSSTHDEDRDRVGDDCDLCPGVADFGLDEDGDGVGDLCDPNDKTSLPNRHLRFEPFVTMPTDWTPDATPWSLVGDAIAPDALLAPADRGLRNTALVTPVGSWAATIGLDSHSHWDSTDTYGISAISASHRVDCTVKCTTEQTGTRCIGAIAVDGSMTGMVTVFPQPTTSVGILVKDNAFPYCVYANIGYVPAPTTPTDGMQISITASPRIRVSYFEYVQ